MSLVATGISFFFIAIGAFFCLVGGIGLIRMPDFYTRMHAASVTETLGAGLILLGLIVQTGLTLVAMKLFMIGLLIFFASPTASHAVAKAALMSGLRPYLGPNNGGGEEAAAGDVATMTDVAESGARPVSGDGGVESVVEGELSSKR